jgi:hypothetical protein
MKNSILKFKGVEKLTNDQLKVIKGGISITEYCCQIIYLPSFLVAGCEDIYC